MKIEYKFEFGDEVIDDITGCTGIVTGWATYITGCNQALVQPKAKEGGEFVEAHWWDEDRLRLLHAKAKLHEVTRAGPDKPAPTK